MHARSRAVQATTVLLVTLLAFAIRLMWLLLAVRTPLPLDGDAIGYMQAATDLIRHWNYSSAREPFFSVVAALFMSILGTTVLAYRFTSVALGTLMVPLTYKVTRETSGATAGLIASLLVATDYLLVWDSIRGLREELFSCLLLTLVLLILWQDRNLGVKDSVMTGILTAMLCLTKVEGFAVAVALGLYCIWHSRVSQGKTSWKLPATLLVSSLIAVLLWCAHSALVFGNPFEQFSGWAGNWAGQEVGGQFVPVSIFDYIFRYHTASQFFGFVIRGFDRVLSMSVQWGYLNWIGFGLFCLGFLCLLKTQKAAVVHFVLLTSLVYVPHFGMPLYQFEPRLFWPYLPIVYLMIAAAATSTYAILTRDRDALIGLGFALDLQVWVNRRIRLLEPRYLAILAMFLPFVVVIIHLVMCLLFFPPQNPNLPYQF